MAIGLEHSRRSDVLIFHLLASRKISGAVRLQRQEPPSLIAQIFPCPSPSSRPTFGCMECSCHRFASLQRLRRRNHPHSNPGLLSLIVLSLDVSSDRYRGLRALLIRVHWRDWRARV